MPPTLQLRTATGAVEIVPGTSVSVIAQADDETGVATVALGGQGAFTVSQAKQVSPVHGAAGPISEAGVGLLGPVHQVFALGS